MEKMLKLVMNLNKEELEKLREILRNAPAKKS